MSEQVDFPFASIADVSARIRDGRLSPVKLVERCVERVDGAIETAIIAVLETAGRPRRFEPVDNSLAVADSLAERIGQGNQRATEALRRLQLHGVIDGGADVNGRVCNARELGKRPQKLGPRYGRLR